MAVSQVLDRIVTRPDDSLKQEIAALFSDSRERIAWPILPHDRESVEALITSSLQMSEVYAGLDRSGGLVGFAFVSDRPGEHLCLESGWLRHTWGTWGAMWRTALLGIMHLGQRDRGALRLEAFVVKPEWRGKGIGSQIMARILADARAKGYPCITIDVDESNEEARHLYEELGFRTTRTMWVICPVLGVKSVAAMQLDL